MFFFSHLQINYTQSWPSTSDSFCLNISRYMKLQYINKYIALSQTAKPKGWFHGERDIHPTQLHPDVSFRPCVWPLKRNASWRWPKRNAKALKPRWAPHETGREGWCNDMSKMGGNVTGSWMVSFRIWHVVYDKHLENMIPSCSSRFWCCCFGGP